ncbi:MAG: mannose-6-phosphate isomerase [Bacteroidales bacterium]|nr:mannose-6-phosphate isomerase [Bacteroidales bacterium]
MASLPGLLKFTPRLRTVRWGGNRLAFFKNEKPTADKVGESWEISALPGMLTEISEGPMQGMTLPGLLDEYGEELMGERLYQRYGTEFPLLIKFIDAEDDLSIQVHPDDILMHGRGKTELWYIIDSAPGSVIYSGLNRTLTPTALRRHIEDHTLTDVLACHHPMGGDVFYLPAGRVHSIGAGNLVLEVQQSSDITYRLWDYERRDENGNLRELHVEKAMRAIDFNQTDYGLARPQILRGIETLVKQTPFFSVTAVLVDDTLDLQVGDMDSFRILVAVDGDGSITANDGSSMTIKCGETVFVPAVTESVRIKSGNRPLKLITVYIA